MDDVTQGDVVTETAGAIVDKGEDGGGGFGGGFGFRFGFATALRRLCERRRLFVRRYGITNVCFGRMTIIQSEKK